MPSWRLACLSVSLVAIACVSDERPPVSATLSAPIAGPFTPGQTYHGRGTYVQYRAGDMPVVVSVPHGGALDPSSIPDRTTGTTASDAFTVDIATRLAAAVRRKTGRRLHLVICELRRTKVDANRDVVEATQGQPDARHAWEDYHALIDAAIAAELQTHAHVVYVDLHGHAHREGRIELGYLIAASVLARPDSALDAARTCTTSSLRALARGPVPPCARLLRGEGSLGALLTERGYAVVPSPAIPEPGGAAYYAGGYSTARHTSDRVVGVQIEAPHAGVRDTPANRQAFADALASSLLAWEPTRGGTAPQRPGDR